MEIRRVKKHDVDMTSGSVFRHLLNFAVPLLMGNIFQQLYNTVDTWVVGNYVSNEAFSAVGTVAPIINTLIGAFSGLASGAGVVISQYYGAGKYDRVKDAVHTAVMMTLVLSVVFTAIGIAMTPNMLRLMKTPAEVFPESRAYLNIYFSGMAGLMLYNMGAGILRAVGDSKRPFYYLVCAAVINTVRDLVFVIAFDMGVEGVAYATIIAQGISAILTMLTLFRSESCVRVELKLIRFHKDMLLKIIKVGIPAALQMAVTAFSNIFVQSYINFFGADCMGGWTAYTKVDQLLFLPMQSIALAATTFVGLNLGKGLADVLFGKVNPAGRTVQTWVKDITDLPDIMDYDIRNGRTYMYHQGPVLYPFGYGLSYSDFAYEKIESFKQDKKNIRVTVSVKNTSGRDGEEVVQLYASYPDSKVERPSKQLRAFKRIPIKAGESREVTLTVPKEELGYWNEGKQMFVVEPGTVKLLIGASSEDIRLEGKIRL